MKTTAASPCRCAAAFFALATMAGVRAATGEAPPVTGIAAAKRDYEEVKTATRTGPEWQRLTLPQTALPALNLRAEALPALAPSPGFANRPEGDNFGEQQKKPKNWLVDAMKQSPDQERRASPQNRRNLGDEAEEQAGDAHRRGVNAGREEILSPTDERGEHPRIQPGEASNPLDHFMAEWMTPQDFKLLKSPSGSDPTGGATALALPGAWSSPSIQEFTLTSGRPDGRQPAGDVRDLPAENPYLATFAAMPAVPSPQHEGALATAAAAIAPPQRGGGGPPPAIKTATSGAKTNSPASDFQKAQDDARYFKQLKRF